MVGPLDDFFGGGLLGKPSFDSTPLGQAAKKAQSDARRNRALPQIRGKRIDDTLYVRAEDVADALERLDPSKCKPLIDKLRQKKD